MTGDDLSYLRKILDSKEIGGPVLEVGSRISGEGSAGSCSEVIEKHGLQYYGADLKKGKHVDFVADFSKEKQVSSLNRKFNIIIIFNVLEHTFNPIQVLDNSITLLEDKGILICTTPTIWPLHEWPIDTYRINPQFYMKYAKKRGLKLEYLHYLGYGQVYNYKDEKEEIEYPPPTKSKLKLFWSRAIHKIANTYARSHHAPSHLSTGAVLRK